MSLRKVFNSNNFLLIVGKLRGGKGIRWISTVLDRLLEVWGGLGGRLGKLCKTVSVNIMETKDNSENCECCVAPSPNTTLTCPRYRLRY